MSIQSQVDFSATDYIAKADDSHETSRLIFLKKKKKKKKKNRKEKKKKKKKKKKKNHNVVSCIGDWRFKG